MKNKKYQDICVQLNYVSMIIAGEEIRIMQYADIKKLTPYMDIFHIKSEFFSCFLCILYSSYLA